MPTTSTSSSSSSSSSQSITGTPEPTRKHAMRASNGSVVANKKKEKAVTYRECRKNHAANIGGYAVDGCREFMASGEEGTSAALRCAACSCHRSFHKREVVAAAAEPDASVCDCSSNSIS